MILSRPWRWVRGRRLVWRILIGVAAGFVLVAGLFVSARAVQYGASDVAAVQFMPESVDFMIEAPDVDGTLVRVRGTPAWDTIEGRILREPEFRKWVDGRLMAAGMPTLDDLEDRRFHRRSGAWFTTDGISRVAGRDFAACGRFTETGLEVCAATKVGFTDFLLLPFAWMLPGLLGAEKENIGGMTCLRMAPQGNEVWIAASGPVAVVANSKPLMEAALMRRSKKKVFDGPGRLRANFTHSPRMQSIRHDLSAGPLSLLLKGVEILSATSVEVTMDVKDRDVFLRSRWDGIPAPIVSATPAPDVPAPARAAGRIDLRTDVEDVWNWMQKVAAGNARGPFAAGVREITAVMRSRDTFEFVLLPQLGEGMDWILASEPWSDGRDYIAAVVVVPVDDGPRVYPTLQKVFREIAGENAFVETYHEGVPMMYARKLPTQLTQEPILRACCAPLPNAVLVGNNPELLKRVLDALEGQGTRFRDTGPAGWFDGEAALNIFLKTEGIHQSMDGTIPLIANLTVDNFATERRLRTEVERENPGMNPFDIDPLVEGRMKNLIANRTGEMRRTVRILSHFRYAGLNARPAEGGFEVNAVLRLR